MCVEINLVSEWDVKTLDQNIQIIIEFKNSNSLESAVSYENKTQILHKIIDKRAFSRYQK